MRLLLLYCTDIIMWSGVNYLKNFNLQATKEFIRKRIRRSSAREKGRVSKFTGDCEFVSDSATFVECVEESYRSRKPTGQEVRDQKFFSHGTVFDDTSWFV